MGCACAAGCGTALLALAALLGLPRAGRADDAASPQWGAGPLDLRDGFVLGLTHLTLGPGSTATRGRGRARLAVRADWAQTSVVDDRSGAVLDAETVEVASIVEYGLTDRIQLGLELPVAYRGAGVLDPFVRAIEKGTARVRFDRLVRPDGEYRVAGATHDGDAFDLDRGLGAGKLRLGLKVRPFDGGPFSPAASIETVVALPTSAPAGFGTAGIDAGVRLAFSKRLGDDLVLGIGATAVHGGGDLGPIELDPFQLGAFGSLEYEALPWLSIVAEAWVESPSTRNLGERGAVFYLGAGVKASWGPISGEIGLVENAGDMSSAGDVAFHVEVGVTF